MVKSLCSKNTDGLGSNSAFATYYRTLGESLNLFVTQFPHVKILRVKNNTSHLGLLRQWNI